MKISRIFSFAMVFFAISGCVDREAQRQAIETSNIVNNPVQTVAVIPAHISDLSRELEITGEVTTSNDTQVGAKSPGRITAIYVRDGDFVTAGQVLARQDTTPLVAQLNQAQSQVLSANAALAQANSQLLQALRNAQVNPYRTTASVTSAEAALQAAQSNLSKVVKGARPQERSQARANLRSAQANLEVQKKQLDRVSILVDQGAFSGSQLDMQKAAYESALATYQNAKDSLSLIEAGNRQEDIDGAREQVRQARQALKTAEATKSLDPLYGDQVATARAGVANAKATIQNAQAQVIIARQGLEDAVIRAPFTGQVSGKPAEVGTIAVPGFTVLRIVGSRGIYFEGNVPGDSIDQIKVGMPVEVKVDAVSTKAFPAKVAAISPMASSVGRLFKVRVQFLGASGDVRPGMFATGRVKVQTIRDAVVVPSGSVISQGDKKYVFLALNGHAKKREVTVGLQVKDDLQIKGLEDKAPVVIEGQDRLVDGCPIAIETSPENQALLESKMLTRNSG